MNNVIITNSGLQISSDILLEEKSKKSTNEGVVNNQRVVYDACVEGDLEKAKADYAHAFKYIGSGTVTFHNGRKSDEKTIQHFFKRKKKNKGTYPL